MSQLTATPSRALRHRRLVTAIAPTSGLSAFRPGFTGLRCRACGDAAGDGAGLRLSPLLRAAGGRPTTWPASVARLDRAIARCPPSPSIWRFAELLPVETVPTDGLRVGPSPARRGAPTGRRLGLERLWVKDDSRNPTLSFKDRVVAVAAARAAEWGFHTLACASHRQPLGRRRRGRGGAAACGRSSSSRPTWSPPRWPRPGAGRHRRARRRPLRRGQPAVPGADRRAGGLGLRQRQPAPLLRRGLQDHRLRDRPAAGLALTGRGRGTAGLGLAVHEARRAAFRELAAVGLLDEAPIRYVGGQAAGCAPIATAWADGADVVTPVERPDTIVRSLAIGSPADGAYAMQAGPRERMAPSWRVRRRRPSTPSACWPRRRASSPRRPAA